MISSAQCDAKKGDKFSTPDHGQFPYREITFKLLAIFRQKTCALLMQSLLITPKDQAELDLLADLLARLNIATTILEENETIIEPKKKPNRIQSLRGSIKGPAANSLNEHLKTIRSEW